VYGFLGGNGGGDPFGWLVERNGVLYGITQSGGTSNLGTVFSLSPGSPRGPYTTETVLYSFTGGSDGASPNAGVVIGPDGILYGETFSGGAAGYGIVFSLTPPATPGGTWTETVLHTFRGGDGAGPLGALAIGGPEGHPVLYGTTYRGGSSSCHQGCGTVFSLTPPAAPGKEWTETVLHKFLGGAEGEYPE